MLYEEKEESKEYKAIRLLTYIAKEFKSNHESTVCFDKDFVLEVIDFLNYAKNEEILMNHLRDKYGS